MQRFLIADGSLRWAFCKILHAEAFVTLNMRSHCCAKAQRRAAQFAAKPTAGLIYGGQIKN